MRTIKVGKKKYAIGFWWQVFSQSKANRQARLEEARHQAAGMPDIGYDCVVLRDSQYGLGRSESGKINKVPSLACSLIKRSEDSWIGLFRVDDQDDVWWVSAVTQKLIAGDGDYYASEEDARHRFNELKALTEWSNEVVCETFTESNTYFQALLATGERTIPLSGEPLGRKIAIAVGILLALAAPWQGWRMYQAHVEAEQAAILAQKAALDQQAAVDPSRVFKRTWLSRPLPSDFASTYMEQRILIFSRGWKSTTVNGDETGLTVTWSHQPGAGFADLPPGAVLDISEPTTARSRTSYIISENRSPRPLDTQLAVMTSLFEATRLSGAHLRGPDWSAPQIETVNQGVGLPPLKVESPWVKGSWTLSNLPESVFRSHLFFDALDQIPGLALTRITRGDTNTLEGVVYALH